MLNTLRKSVAGPFVKLLIGILILSFAVWGIQDIFGNYKNSVAIEIDGNEISLDELVNEYNYQLSTISSQLNKQISFDESMALGIDKIAIENLIRKMILRIELNKYGINIPEEFIAQKIVNDDAFKSEGVFNKARYRQLLSFSGYTEESFLISELNANKQNQLYSLIANKNYIPNTLLDIINDYNSTEKVINYIEIPKKNISVKTPSERELLEFYDKFQNGYRKSETRDFDALILNADSLKNNISVSQTEIQNYYNENIDSFKVEETRDVYQFFFDDLITAEEFLAESKSVSFEILLDSYNLSKSDDYLGNIRKDDILDSDLAQIAFNIDAKSFSNPIDGLLGLSIVYIDEIYEGSTPPLNELASTIEEEIKLEAALNLIDDVFFSIEDDFLSGMHMQEVADKNKINLTSFAKVDINGKDLDNNDINVIQNDELLQKLFNSGIGDFIEVVETEDNYIWIKLNAINEPFIKSFKDVRDLVTTDMIKQRLDKKEKEIIAEIEDALINNNLSKETSESLNIEIKKSKPFSRNKPIIDFSQDFNDRILSADINETIIGRSPDEILIGKVTEIIPSNSSALIRDNDQVEGLDYQLRSDLFEQFLSSLEESYDVTLFQGNIDR
ncbi:MAG: SurA N-terminal domain-containing protein, partial [Hyphomicrobiales bacterium]